MKYIKYLFAGETGQKVVILSALLIGLGIQSWNKKAEVGAIPGLSKNNRKHFSDSLKARNSAEHLIEFSTKDLREISKRARQSPNTINELMDEYKIKLFRSDQVGDLKMDKVFELYNDALASSRRVDAKRTRVGQVSRVIEGLSAGDICFGYRSRPTKTRSRGGYEIPSHFEIDVHLDEARSVVLMFDLRIKGLGFAAIAKEFNRRGIPSSQRAQKISGKKINWSQNTVRKMLQSKKYIGQWTWGCSTRILNPETKKLERHDQSREKWVSHHEGEKIRDDLIIIDQERWLKVQSMFKTRVNKETASADKWAAAREEKTNGIKSNALLAGILRCAECGGNMLQITGRKGGFFGCFVHHRKDKSKCSNRRTISRRKIEAAVAAELKVVLLDEHNLNMATKLINKKIKDRLSVTPEEIRSLMRDKFLVEKEIRNFTKFVRDGDSSAIIRDELREAEDRIQIIDSRLNALQAARVENLLVTPAAMRARFENLAEILGSDPVLANAALRKLIPAGLSCRPESTSAKKNLNQNNSKWTITGEIHFVGAAEQTLNVVGYTSATSQAINLLL